MKAKYMILLVFYLLTQISATSNYGFEILHEDAEMAKICQLRDGKVLALTSSYKKQETEITKFEKNVERIYQKFKIAKGYTISSQVAESQTKSEYYLIHHNKQDIQGSDSHEFVLKFKDNDEAPTDNPIKNSIYKTTSIVPLRNGNILLIGTNPISTSGGETTVDFTLYNPLSNTFENGKSFNKVYDNLISCYEQMENHVYCAYVAMYDVFIYKLALKHLIVQNGVVNEVEDLEIIKNFYTAFNFIKALPYNEKEIVILFQTGKTEILETPYGNDGKDLYFYHYDINAKSVIRYEYLFNDCTYNKNSENANADIIVLSKNRIFAVCEHGNSFKGFSIVVGEKHIDRFEIKGFSSNSVKNPVFAKFDKNLALFFTQEKSNTIPQVVYSMLNYPDCINSETDIFLPRKFIPNKSFPLNNYILMSNPYPESRAYETIKVRFLQLPITLYDKNRNEIELNKDYDSTTEFFFFSESQEGKYSIEFTATREDEKDGEIIGNTCKLGIYTPKCLDQCLSCNQTGNENYHYCHGCKNESFYEDKMIQYSGQYFDKLHNCYPCDYSCYSCNGALIPQKTTNCKKCYYERGYYPYENDKSLCISEETQNDWEVILNMGIYLDKPNVDDETTWVWKNCHYNCRKCKEKGDDKNNKCDYCRTDFYFYCNQTTTNGGIPGSCHNDCVDHGFYPIEKENRLKCCPCLNHCEKCNNDTICNLCDKDYFLTLDSKACVDDCGYCLAEDVDKRKCVNCKDKNPQEFLLNKTCVPSLYYKNFTYHIIDDTCNLLMGCKEGCYKCAPWYSDECTECKKDYYKEDFYGITPQPNTFRCFNKSVCQGIAQYPHNKDLRVGGVAIIEDGKEVCLNCKLRNDSFRQPEYNFFCGPKINMTYVDIEDYNKLSECYFRCKSCDTWGNSFKMNCTSCRDGANYEHILYHAGYGNCYRKTHKCGIYPYYHDYEIAEAMGYNEDDCGEKCDVCLYNFSCTEHFPYFRYETHECVEYCPLPEVLTNSCNMNNSVALIILLRNPFGLRNPYDFLNSTVTIQQFISSSLFQYIANSYNLDVNTLMGDINNYIGNGKIYNLQESQVIVGNNITLELTTFKLELEKLIKKITGKSEDEKTDSGDDTNGGKSDEPSIVDLSECEALLKKKYGLSDEEDLMIIKGDLLKQLSDDYLGNSVDYQIFSTSLGAFLPLTDCQEAGTSVSVTNPFNSLNLLTQYQSKTGAVTTNGYNPFDVNSPFYNDICTAFTNENGNDVLLDDRRKDYFDENVNLCESGCKFVGYNISTNMYTCICNIKAVPGDEAGEYTGDYVTNEMPKGFKDMISKRSNIEVFKCSSQVFSSKGQKKNFGSYILLFALASLIGVVVFHYVKERGLMDNTFDKLAKLPDSSIKSNPPKPTEVKDSSNSKKEKKENTKKKERKVPQNNYDIIGKTTKRNLSKEKPKNVTVDLKLTEAQLNNVPYDKAIEKDKRSFIQYYWSLLKSKQLFIFTFYTSDDYILRSTKIALFILFISFYLVFTALFFNDSIMRAIYIYKGNTNAAVHIPNIILSSLCCLVSSLIVRFVSLNERDISKIAQSTDEVERTKIVEQMKKIIKIKLIILYAISGILIMLFWYYVSAFCAVFKNSQGHYFTNVLVAFIVCNIWPCVISLIPAFLRTKALENKSKKMYIISQIVAYF